MNTFTVTSFARSINRANYCPLCLLLCNWIHIKLNLKREELVTHLFSIITNFSALKHVMLCWPFIGRVMDIWCSSWVNLWDHCIAVEWNMHKNHFSSTSDLLVNTSIWLFLQLLVMSCVIIVNLLLDYFSTIVLINWLLQWVRLKLVIIFNSFLSLSFLLLINMIRIDYIIIIILYYYYYDNNKARNGWTFDEIGIGLSLLTGLIRAQLWSDCALC